MRPVVVEPEDHLHAAFAGAGHTEGRIDRNWCATSSSPSCSARSATSPTRTGQDFEAKQRVCRPAAFIQKLRGDATGRCRRVVHAEPGTGRDPRPQEAMAPSAHVRFQTTPTAFDRAERGYGKARSPTRTICKRLQRVHQESPQPDSGAGDRADTATRVDPQTAARTGLGAGPGRLHRNQPRLAWRELTNQDIAARIVGYIRQAAIGDALVPYEQRVDRACRICWRIRLQASPGHTAARVAASASLRRPRPTSGRPRRHRRPRPDLQARRRRLQPAGQASSTANFSPCSTPSTTRSGPCRPLPTADPPS
jgi:type I restriction enzyme R subunit